MRKLRSHKLLYHNRKGVIKVHKGIFYARDADTLRFLITLARCPSGQIVPAKDVGIDFPASQYSQQ